MLSTLLVVASSTSLGDGLWRSANLALKGTAPALPLTMNDAEAQNWKLMNTTCDPQKGYRYAFNSNLPSASTPMTLYYTAAGQLAGVATELYGLGSAPQHLVDLGFWVPVGTSGKQWTMSVSFRAPSVMCSKNMTDEVLGDRLIVNQGTLNRVIPTTVSEATAQKWTVGSCVKTMGQHWEYDLSSAPQMSWQSDNLLPVVPMYWPPTENGTINAFFFTTPSSQTGTNQILHSPGDWDMPAISPAFMCLNFCVPGCEWPGVNQWSVMHIYLNSQWSYLQCPGAKRPTDAVCPDSLDIASL